MKRQRAQNAYCSSLLAGAFQGAGLDFSSKSQPETDFLSIFINLVRFML